MAPTHSLLIVDDEPAVLLTLQMILQSSGYSVTTAESTSEALRLMEQPNQYDAVLTDLHMDNERSG